MAIGCLLLAGLLFAPDWLYAAGAFLRDMGRLIVLGK